MKPSRLSLRNDDSPDRKRQMSKRPETHRKIRLALGVGLGIGAGILLGEAVGNPAIGIGVGTALGTALGLMMATPGQLGANRKLSAGNADGTR